MLAKLRGALGRKKRGGVVGGRGGEAGDDGRAASARGRGGGDGASKGASEDEGAAGAGDDCGGDYDDYDDAAYGDAYGDYGGDYDGEEIADPEGVASDDARDWDVPEAGATEVAAGGDEGVLSRSDAASSAPANQSARSSRSQSQHSDVEGSASGGKRSGSGSYMSDSSYFSDSSATSITSSTASVPSLALSGLSNSWSSEAGGSSRRTSPSTVATSSPSRSVRTPGSSGIGRHSPRSGKGPVSPVSAKRRTRTLAAKAQALTLAVRATGEAKRARRLEYLELVRTERRELRWNGGRPRLARMKDAGVELFVSYGHSFPEGGGTATPAPTAFVAQPAEALICPVCADVLYDPVEMPDHTDVMRTICRECAAHEFGDRDAHKAKLLKTVAPVVEQLMESCIMCRHGLDVTSLDGAPAIRMNMEGCSEVVKLADRAEHEQNCPKAFVQCGLPHSLNASENCKMLVRRDELDEHRAKCKHRMLTCPHDGCGLQVQVHRLAAHVKICGHRWIVCPNRGARCWKGPRKELARHLVECAGEKVACGFDDTDHGGNPCPVMLPRGEIDAHRLVCGYRSVNCPMCGERISYRFRGRHDVECGARWSTCGMCGERVHWTKREAHVAQSCGAVAIDCAYARYGCSERPLRAHYAEHDREKTAEHLTMLVRGPGGVDELTRKGPETRRLALDCKQVVTELASTLKQEVASVKIDAQRIVDARSNARQQLVRDIEMLESGLGKRDLDIELDGYKARWSERMMELYNDFDELAQSTKDGRTGTLPKAALGRLREDGLEAAEVDAAAAQRALRFMDQRRAAVSMAASMVKPCVESARDKCAREYEHFRTVMDMEQLFSFNSGEAMHNLVETLSERNQHEWEQIGLTLDRIDAQVDMVLRGEFISAAQRSDMQAATRRAVKQKLERAKNKLRGVLASAKAAQMFDGGRDLLPALERARGDRAEVDTALKASNLSAIQSMARGIVVEAIDVACAIARDDRRRPSADARIGASATSDGSEAPLSSELSASGTSPLEVGPAGEHARRDAAAGAAQPSHGDEPQADTAPSPVGRRADGLPTSARDSTAAASSHPVACGALDERLPVLSEAEAQTSELPPAPNNGATVVVMTVEITFCALTHERLERTPGLKGNLTDEMRGALEASAGRGSVATLRGCSASSASQGTVLVYDVEASAKGSGAMGIARGVRCRDSTGRSMPSMLRNRARALLAAIPGSVEARVVGERVTAKQAAKRPKKTRAQRWR